MVAGPSARRAGNHSMTIQPKVGIMLAQSYAREFWTRTTADLSDRRLHLKTPAAQGSAQDAVRIVIDPSLRRQNWIGAGAAVTDATAYLLWEVMDAGQRGRLLRELFDPVDGAGFSLVRIPMGSCDFNKQDYYTYDDLPFGSHDSELKRFSIGEGTPGAPEATKDLKYIVPVLREILDINPGVKIVAAPWSAPAWMKNTGNLTEGGRLRFGEWTGIGYDPMRDGFEGVYARYFVRFIDEYAKYGIPIHAVSLQNEPAVAAPWPAMTWSIQQLADFGHRFLRPALRASHPDVRMLFLDDNPYLMNEPLSNLMSRDQAHAFDGIAVHTYTPPYDRLHNATDCYPEWTVMMSERRCMMTETPEDASHIMFGVNCNWMIQQGMGMLTLWNLALDERGLPNRAGSTGRRGVITINHRTGEVRRNLEYFMLRNLGQDVPVGSQVIASSNYTTDGYTGGLGSSAFLSPDGGVSCIVYNPTGKAIDAAVTVNGAGAIWQRVTVPAWGVVTFRKTNGTINTSAVPVDDDFPLDPTPANFAGDVAPGTGNGYEHER